MTEPRPVILKHNGLDRAGELTIEEYRLGDAVSGNGADSAFAVERHVSLWCPRCGCDHTRPETWGGRAWYEIARETEVYLPVEDP